MAASALPLNPERVPNASDLEYINFNNPACFPYTFTQGIFEQRMFIDALANLTIDPSVVSAGCTGMSLPTGETAYHFLMTPLHAQGQSMGGMYTNLVSATDARIKIAVPTGAGGYWSFMVLTTNAIQNAPNDLKLLLGSGDLTFMHPALHLLETAWEPAEPFVYMPRLAYEPLAGHPVRPVYEPVGFNDMYFSTGVYDGAALAYHNKESGNVVWPTMQTTLMTEGLSGIVPYPVTTTSPGVVAQYNGDGVNDPHYIAITLDAVKYQYSCFHQTFQQTGTAIVYAPQALTRRAARDTNGAGGGGGRGAPAARRRFLLTPVKMPQRTSRSTSTRRIHQSSKPLRALRNHNRPTCPPAGSRTMTTRRARVSTFPPTSRSFPLPSHGWRARALGVFPDAVALI